MASVLRLTTLVKRFYEFTLGPLELDLEPGSVVAYVGPNGSGKTTTMHCIAGLLGADEGRIEVFGRPATADDVSWKLDVGYVGHGHPFFERWTGERNLALLSHYFPGWSRERAADLARRFGLPLDRKVRALSRGNRVKLALVCVLARSPRLLLLDEPTAGLDPVVRDEVLEVLFEIVGHGDQTILYSTHVLSDVSRLADEFVFLIDGSIRMRRAKDDLIEEWRRISYRLVGNGARLPAVVRHRREGDDHQVVSSDFAATLAQLRRVGAENIRDNRMTIDEIAVQILRGGPHASDR